MTYRLLINGRTCIIDADAATPLARVLREKIGLTGTKIGCGNGECGACTVVMDKKAVCSCLVPVARAAGRDVITIEGLSGQESGLHPLQRAFVENGALQCGFCTPGMIMSAYALLLWSPRITEQDVVDALAGNICRCTGYRKIIDAVLSVNANEEMLR